MSPPVYRHNDHGKSNKRVEFAPQLESISSEGPQSPSPDMKHYNHASAAAAAASSNCWDSETGDSNNHDNNNNENDYPMYDFTVTAHTKSSPDDREDLVLEDCNDDSIFNKSVRKDSNDYTILPPPTPATQFYSSSAATNKKESLKPGHAQLHPHYYAIHQQHAQAYFGQKGSDEHGVPGAGALTSSSSSSSSLSSMTHNNAAAATAHPVYHSHLSASSMPITYSSLNHKANTGDHANATSTSENKVPSPGAQQSPISPAAMIGTGNENLMLPPPARNMYHNSYNNSNKATTSDGQNPDEARQRHLDWLRDINARAKAAASSSQNAGTDSATNTGSNDVANNNTEYMSNVQSMSANTMQHNTTNIPGMPATIVYPDATMMHPATHMYAGNPMHMMMMLHPAAALQAYTGGGRRAKVVTQEESKEKRAKRLERNRESARKSRRRKKEKLEKLGKKVDQLHGQIDVERSKQIFGLVEGLKKSRIECLDLSLTEKNAFLHTIRKTGPQSQIAQGVSEFQFTTMKQHLNPRYQKLLFWFALRHENYFIGAKEDYNTRPPDRQNIKSSSGRISSKQIGEEITTQSKVDSGPGLPFKTDDDREKPGQTAFANDFLRFWPLFCYEFSLSVDQEEKFITAHKKTSQQGNLLDNWNQSAAVVKTADSVREAIDSVSTLVSDREERALVNTLHHGQVSVFSKWMSTNRHRCREAIQRRDVMESTSPPDSSKDASLNYICKKLNEVLKISKADR